ncbi:MAG: glycosyltransferase family 2 protein [Deltaproteobacteria bacterium]|nr:MAG: glycosyltransferase family 2 protein [Deltaproteobacteria bacterium]
MTDLCDLTIVIPAYNERDRIGPTLAAVDAFLAAAGQRYEIVVVDDGSTDGTAEFVRRIARARPAIRCIATRPNRGKGSAVRVGMLAARGAVRVLYDADGSIPATELPKVVNPVALGDADIAIGSRYVAGAAVDRPQPRYRVAWSRLANAVTRLVLVPGIRDTQCGCKALSAEAARDVFRRTRIDGWSFDLEVLAIARDLGYSVREVGVTWSDDPRSRIHPVRDAVRGVRELLAIRRNRARGLYRRPALPADRDVAAPAAGPRPTVRELAAAR